MNTFADIFKKSFLEGFSGSDITTARILVTLMVTCAIALYIFVVYYVATKKNYYSKTFNISLALIAVITASIILAMQSNLVISLGMVGALSIVRFRTAIKDPMDLIFLFWSISTGIICGAEMYKIAVITALILTIGLFALELTPVGKASVLLIVNAKGIDDEPKILEVVTKHAKRAKVKSRNVSSDSLDMILDIKTANEQQLLKEIMEVPGVFGASLMAHDGEITMN
ncbi:MAG: DUF4956 domain-containing protein [Lachnospiraceae bacterium]|nr:DUF4956 domain-containing protein [Lachnospiraceae bacterium]